MLKLTQLMNNLYIFIYLLLYKIYMELLYIKRMHSKRFHGFTYMKYKTKYSRINDHTIEMKDTAIERHNK